MNYIHCSLPTSRLVQRNRIDLYSKQARNLYTFEKKYNVCDIFFLHGNIATGQTLAVLVVSSATPYKYKVLVMESLVTNDVC